MGHIVGKDVFRDLGQKIDTLNVKVPWNETFHAILQELYSLAEADLVVRMPSSLSTMEELEAVTRLGPSLWANSWTASVTKDWWWMCFLITPNYYTPSPLIIGIFEFTMMRMDNHRGPQKKDKP